MMENSIRELADFLELLPQAMQQVKEAMPDSPFPLIGKTDCRSYFGVDIKTFNSWVEKGLYGLKFEPGTEKVRADVLMRAYTMRVGLPAAKEAALEQRENGLRKAV